MPLRPPPSTLTTFRRRPSVFAGAWEQELWWAYADPEFLKDHRDVFDLLGVEYEQRAKYFEVRWTEEQARAFQLLHVLTHELGHHHDRMTTRSRRQSARGEDYAELYAQRVVEVVWPAYVAAFGV